MTIVDRARRPLAPLILALPLAACGGPTVEGSGHAAVVARSLGAFTAVAARDGFTVDVRVGRGPGVTVFGDDNVVGHVGTEVRGSTLVVTRTPADVELAPTLPVIVAVDAPSVAALEASDGSSLAAWGLAGAIVRLTSSGGSRVVLAGASESASLAVSGGGDLDAANLRSVAVDLTGTDRSTASVCATASLHVALTGASRADVHCAPAKLDQSLDGGSEVVVR